MVDRNYAIVKNKVQFQCLFYTCNSSSVIQTDGPLLGVEEAVRISDPVQATGKSVAQPNGLLCNSNSIRTSYTT